MAYDKLVDSSQLNSDLGDVADAIRAKSGGSSQLAFPSGFISEIGNISTGASVADGIVVKARGANGRATEVDFYGSAIEQMQFYNYNANNGTWSFVERINYMDDVTIIKTNGLYGCKSLTNLPESLQRVEQSGCSSCGFVNLYLPNLTIVYGGSTFSSCSNLQTIVAPKLVTFHGNYNFVKCTAMTLAEFGSVGHTVTAIPNTTFGQVAQQGLTVTVYTTGNLADSITANIRKGATNATIIIKASENTTYNGTTYNAGDTILTSEVTS